MKKFDEIWMNRIVTILGVIVLVLPFTGFPHSWTDKFYFLLGLAVAALSFQVGKYLVFGKGENK